MSLVTDIWNQAAGRIGQLESITDELAEGATARWCRIYYAQARDATLQAYDWSFARRVTWPATLSGQTAPVPWSYCLQMPAGALAIRGYHCGDIATGPVDAMAEPAFVVSEATDAGTTLRQAYYLDLVPEVPAEPFRVAGTTSALGADSRYLLTMTEGGFVWYTRKVTDASQFDPLFTDAVAWKLAADLAMSKAGARELRNDALQMYQRVLETAAIASSRQEKRPRNLRQGDYLAAYR
jgi:hypothetical protein